MTDEVNQLAEKLSDKQAKGILLQWPTQPTNWFPDGQRWLRAQPTDGGRTGPRLLRPGLAETSPKTQPDGLWFALLQGQALSASIFVVEVCGTAQNLHDKRSR